MDNRPPPSPLVRRALGYAATTLSGSAVSLVSIPIVIGTVGAVPWSRLAIGQSTAAIFSIVVLFGWGITGPARVAVASPPERARMFAASIVLRVWLCIVTFPIFAVALRIVVGHTDWAATLMGAGVLVTGLGATWYFTGTSQPSKLFWLDTMPRNAATVLSLVLVLLIRNLVVYAAVQLLGCLVAALISWHHVLVVENRGHTVRLHLWPTRYLGELREQGGGVLAAASAVLYVNAPLPLLAAVAPRAVPAYALADRVLKFLLNALSPVTAVAQGWVPHADVDVVRRRIRGLLPVVGVGAMLIGAVYAVALPEIDALISGGNIQLGPSLTAGLGLALACIVISGVTGLACLAAFRRFRAVALSTIVGAVIGVPLVLLLGRIWGGPGAAWAVGFSELFVLIVQAIALRRALHAEIAPSEPAVVGPGLLAP